MIAVDWMVSIFWYAAVRAMRLFGSERNKKVIPDHFYCYTPDTERNNKRDKDSFVYYTIPCPYYKWLGKPWHACTFCGVITDDDVFGDQVKICGLNYGIDDIDN
jgi:hypothetical protein